MALVEIEHLSIRFEGTPAVSDLSLRIERSSAWYTPFTTTHIDTQHPLNLDPLARKHSIAQAHTHTLT